MAAVERDRDDDRADDAADADHHDGDDRRGDPGGPVDDRDRSRVVVGEALRAGLAGGRAGRTLGERVGGGEGALGVDLAEAHVGTVAALRREAGALDEGLGHQRGRHLGVPRADQRGDPGDQCAGVARAVGEEVVPAGPGDGQAGAGRGQHDRQVAVGEGRALVRRLRGGDRDDARVGRGVGVRREPVAVHELAVVAVVAHGRHHDDALADGVADGVALGGDLSVPAGEADLAERQVDDVGAVVGGVPDALRDGVLRRPRAPVARVARVLLLADDADGEDPRLGRHPDDAVAAARPVAVPRDQRRHPRAVQVGGLVGAVDGGEHVGADGDGPGDVLLVRVDAGVHQGDGDVPALGDLPGGVHVQLVEDAALPLPDDVGVRGRRDEREARAGERRRQQCARGRRAPPARGPLAARPRPGQHFHPRAWQSGRALAESVRAIAEPSCGAIENGSPGRSFRTAEAGRPSASPEVVSTT
ncbi:hypothetical protein amrb99_94510 [Actinomadura sp. RB99]|nr:hypothetical protein [Actinomadura sp. RB99]